jgi:phage protein D
MSAIDFEVIVGSLKAKSSGQSSVHLLSLTSEIGAGGPGHAAIELRSADAALPRPGDATTITLGGKKVFTGEALSIKATPETLFVMAVDGLAKLERAPATGAYKDKTAGAIAKDILAQAGLDAGTIEEGPRFASYALGKAPRAMRHIERLAEQAGFIVYGDGDGRAHFVAPRSGGADATIEYTKHVLNVELTATASAFDGVVVWGEGAAGAKGADKAHWLVTSLASLSGKAAIGADGSINAASAGKRPLTVRDGAVRAAADASDQAKARMSALAARAIRGSIEILGDPERKPGDLVELHGAPKAHAVSALIQGVSFWVHRVRHTLTTSRGFVTRLDVWGSGSPSGALGPGPRAER